MKFGCRTGPKIPHLTCLDVQLRSIYSIPSKAIILLCPKRETKKDWLEIQRSRPSGGLLSPREHDIPRVIRLNREPYEIAKMLTDLQKAISYGSASY